MLFERGQELFGGLALRFGLAAANAEPGFDEGAHQPGPDRALMIGRVALFRAAGAVWRIVWRARRERAQAEGREQTRFNSIDHTAGAFAIEQRQRQSADRE